MRGIPECSDIRTMTTPSLRQFLQHLRPAISRLKKLLPLTTAGTFRLISAVPVKYMSKWVIFVFDEDGYFLEKALEHYLSLEFLELCNEDLLLDI